MYMTWRKQCLLVKFPQRERLVPINFFGDASIPMGREPIHILTPPLIFLRSYAQWKHALIGQYLQYLMTIYTPYPLLSNLACLL